MRERERERERENIVEYTFFHKNVLTDVFFNSHTTCLHHNTVIYIYIYIERERERVKRPDKDNVPCQSLPIYQWPHGNSCT